MAVAHAIPTAPRSPARAIPSTNRKIAKVFERIAALLAAHDGDPHRIVAYRRAARMLRGEARDVGALAEAHGEGALRSLRGVGAALAAEMMELHRSGRLRLLERLEERACPRKMLARVPSIGPTLARRIVDELRVETLEDLELAVHDGRLERVRGFGKQRIQLIRRALAEALGRHRSRGEGVHPLAALLLEIDARYRKLAKQNQLHTVAPHRFNPKHEAWLPMMKVARGGWRFTVMFSNTARAHQLGMTQDWVIIASDRDGQVDRCTVVTEHRGPEAGLRVIRGREVACREHYRRHPPPRIRLPMPSFLVPAPEENAS